LAKWVILVRFGWELVRWKAENVQGTFSRVHAVGFERSSAGSSSCVNPLKTDGKHAQLHGNAWELHPAASWVLDIACKMVACGVQRCTAGVQMWSEGVSSERPLLPPKGVPLPRIEPGTCGMLGGKSKRLSHGGNRLSQAW